MRAEERGGLGLPKQPSFCLLSIFKILCFYVRDDLRKKVPLPRNKLRVTGAARSLTQMSYFYDIPTGSTPVSA